MNEKYKESMLNENALIDKVVVITGGGTGLGKSMAKYFLEIGAKVVITSRKLDVLKKTAKELYEITGGEIVKELESKYYNWWRSALTQHF